MTAVKVGSSDFSESDFWGKIHLVFKQGGRELLRKVLTLYYTMTSAMTPKWAKALILAALAYFVLPVDAVLDLLPGIGFADDASVIAATLAAVALFVTPGVRKKVEKKLGELFSRKKKK